MEALTIETHSVEETQELGRRLGAALTVGHVVALIGPLGAGKTALTRGLALGAGVSNPRAVSSPTFVIVNEYEAPHSPALRVLHIDAYRLRGAGDLDALGFDEMCTRGAVVIEWADRVMGLLPEDRFSITLEPLDADSRRLTCTAYGPASRGLLRRLSAG